MENEIAERKVQLIKKDTGYEIQGKSKILFVPKQELLSYGCKNCVWKLNNQCVKGYTNDKEFEDYGICQEMAEFILNLAEGEDSISALWEKFHIYTLRVQTQQELKELRKVEDEIIKAKQDGDRKEINRLEAKKNTLKLWWLRFNESATKGLGRVVDREVRLQEPTAAKSINIQNLNVQINNRVKELEAHEQKVKDGR